MCGTGDINVQDFKAHAVIVGGSWHFREKVGGGRFSSGSAELEFPLKTGTAALDRR